MLSTNQAKKREFFAGVLVPAKEKNTHAALLPPVWPSARNRASAEAADRRGVSVLAVAAGTRREQTPGSRSRGLEVEVSGERSVEVVRFGLSRTPG